ncbi:MAG: alpha/beta fold hydrolase [Promethearchaeati archaeon SRVP18_Atabeyarchaeia-1]
MNRNLAIILVVGVIVFSAGLTPLILVNAQSPSQTFSTTSSDGTRIVYDVTMRPGTPMNAPVAVLIHGFSGNRIMMRMMAFALADKGFICASIDLRGHGSSEGVMDGTGSFVDDVYAVIGALHASGIGNTSRLLLVGHSMGGGVVLTLGTQLTSVAAIIGVAPASSPAWVNTTTPKNLLLIISTGDSVINATTVKQTFNKSVGLPSWNPNTIYHVNGTDRELFVVAGPDHLGILYNAAVISQIVYWATTYVMGAGQPLGTSPDVIYLAVYVSIAGGVIMIISALALVHEKLWQQKKKPETKGKTDVKNLLILGVLAVLLAGVLGSVVAVVMTFVLVLVTPLFVTNFLMGIFLGNSITLGIFAMMKLRHSSKEFSYRRFLRESIIRPSVKVDLASGIVGAIAFMALLAVTFGGNTTLTFSTASIRLISLPLCILIFGLVFMFYESFFKAVARPLMADGAKRMVLSVIFELIVLLVAFVIELVIITTLLSLAMPSLGVGSLILGLGLQMVLLVLVPLSIGVLSAELFYGKTGGWLTQIIIGALLFATLTVVFSPVLYLF